MDIFAGERLLGKTPLIFDPNEIPDVVSLTLKKEHFLDRRISLDSLPGKSIVINLESNGATTVFNENQFVNKEYQSKGLYPARNWLITASISAIGLGSLTAYYKNKADKKFEKAKIARRSGDLELRERLQKSTKKYDRYAAVAFVGMQVNLGLFMYFLLTSN